jgi:UDP-N-acetylmuramate--alanine ligase
MNPSDHIHLIGIGGTGLSAIARVLHERGMAVSGSDRQASPLSDALQALGVRVTIGHRPENVNGATLIVRSSAIPDTNPEVERARQRGIPVLKRADFLGELMAGKTCIAIAGTHGKTTTTALTAFLLTRLGFDPSYIVGGTVRNLGNNARAGQGPHFVIEADEYDRMFHGLTPHIAVITNVEHDHPDCFPTPEDFTAAFRGFAGGIDPQGTLLAFGDDPVARSLAGQSRAARRATVTYGFTPDNHLRAHNLSPVEGAGFAFDVAWHGRELGRVQLQVPGQHNVLNALAVLGIGITLGLGFDRMEPILREFHGAGRRFEVLGEAGGVTIIDDYAHHPTEIRATIAAAAARYPSRPLWALWQPHTFSRVQALWAEFAACFWQAQHVIVTDVYAARETAPRDFSLAGLIEAMGHMDARHVSGLGAAAEHLAGRLSAGDVLLVLSAGDADAVSAQVFARLAGAGSPPHMER